MASLKTRGDLVKAGYNAIATRYLSSRTSTSEDVQLLQDLIERLSRGAKVLDIGCGAGVPVTELLVKYFDVTGVDLSEKQIELARKLVPGATFICSDMNTLAFPDASFDAICSYYALIHVPRVRHRRILHNLHRMLKPNGLLLITLGLGNLPSSVEPDFFGAPNYWSHYGARTNIKMVKACGLEVLWAKVIDVSHNQKFKHLFVLAQKLRPDQQIRKPQPQKPML